MRKKVEASEKAAVLHIDTWGPATEVSLGGARYYILALKEFSDYKHIEFVSSRAEIPRAVKKVITRTQLESKRPVLKILTDNGTEYLNNQLTDWLEEKAIIHDTTVRYTPKQNGKVERERSVKA